MSRPRFLADHDFNEHIARGIQRQEPALEVLLARQFGLERLSDSSILDFAAHQDCIVLSHDVSTMSAAAKERILIGLEMKGLFLVPQSTVIGPIIHNVILIWACSEAEEWDKQIQFLPL